MTHPAKDLLIAIAMGQQMQWHGSPEDWFDCNTDFAIAAISRGDGHRVRIATGQPGYVTKVVCYPEGLTVIPDRGRTYFWLAPEGVDACTWLGDSTDIALFKNGLCYPATPEGEAHAKLAWEARFGGEW